MPVDSGSKRTWDLPEEDRQRLTEILAKIDHLAQASRIEADWMEELNKLLTSLQGEGPLPSKEDRLLIYRAARDAAIISAEAAFFLISYTLEWLAADRINDDFKRQMDAAEKSASLEEIRKLTVRDPERERLITATCFRDYGEYAMADLLLTDPGEFERRKETGRSYFFGKEEGKEQH